MLENDANAVPTPAQSQYTKIILKRMKVLNERPCSSFDFPERRFDEELELMGFARISQFFARETTPSATSESSYVLTGEEVYQALLVKLQ